MLELHDILAPASLNFRYENPARPESARPESARPESARLSRLWMAKKPKEREEKKREKKREREKMKRVAYAHSVERVVRLSQPRRHNSLLNDIGTQGKVKRIKSTNLTTLWSSEATS
jgi:hypothetical protein